VAQIVDKRLAADNRQREGSGVACLAFRDRHALTLPVDVVERQRSDLAAAAPK
jgi:hypothetical protein